MSNYENINSIKNINQYMHIYKTVCVNTLHNDAYNIQKKTITYNQIPEFQT